VIFQTTLVRFEWLAALSSIPSWNYLVDQDLYPPLFFAFGIHTHKVALWCLLLPGICRGFKFSWPAAEKLRGKWQTGAINFMAIYVDFFSECNLHKCRLKSQLLCLGLLSRHAVKSIHRSTFCNAPTWAAFFLWPPPRRTSFQRAENCVIKNPIQHHRIRHIYGLITAYLSGLESRRRDNSLSRGCNCKIS